MARAKRSAINYNEKQPQEPIPFDQFFAVYAALEQWDHIPQFHLEILEFLSNDIEWTNDTAVLQCFRNGAKSTIVAAYIVWKLVHEPKLIFLIQSADDNTAAKMVGDCQKIIMAHPMAMHLKGDRLTWGAKGFRVVGSKSGRNLSVSARGIFSNVTGGRADIIIYDDVEVPRNSESAELRVRIRQRASESSHLLNPKGKRLFVGTPHSWNSLYPEIIDRGASSMRFELLQDMTGEFPFYLGRSTWPERWTPEMILKKQKECTGKSEFLSQYQLIPVSSEESHLDPGNIRTYKSEPQFIEANREKLCIFEDRKVTRIVAFWDPALSKASGDNSVVAVAFCDQDGHIYVHRTIDVVGNAEEQCQQVKDILIQFRVPAVRIETNGIGGFLPQLLLGAVRGLGIGVDGKATRTSKADSILEAFETPLSASLLHVHESVLNTKFLQQLRDFNPRFQRGKDDFLDSAAKAIHMLPVTVGRGINNTLEGFTAFRARGVEVEIERDVAFG